MLLKCLLLVTNTHTCIQIWACLIRPRSYRKSMVGECENLRRRKIGRGHVNIYASYESHDRWEGTHLFCLGCRSFVAYTPTPCMDGALFLCNMSICVQVSIYILYTLYFGLAKILWYSEYGIFWNFETVRFWFCTWFENYVN